MKPSRIRGVRRSSGFRRAPSSRRAAVGGLIYRRSMLALTIVATVVAAVSAVIAAFALKHAKDSAADAKRSADAAETSAGAATITAAADRAADLRAREPQLIVTVDAMVPHDGQDAIYRVLNEGPQNLDSVVVHRPVLGEVEGRIVHQVAHTGGTGYQDQAPLGAIPVTEYQRFTLNLGVREDLPEFRVKIVCRSGDDAWTVTRVLDNPRRGRPPRVSSVVFGR